MGFTDWSSATQNTGQPWKDAEPEGRTQASRGLQEATIYQRLITQANKNAYKVGMNTYRVPDLQTLTLPLTRVGYAILAGGGEEEIKVFRLIPD